MKQNKNSHRSENRFKKNVCWRSIGAVGLYKQFSVWLSILPEPLTKTNSTITCAMLMECQSTMTELKVSVSEFCYNQKITMIDEGPKELVPWGHEQPFHIPRNGTGLLSSSSSSSLSIWHHCDLSVFKAEQDWFEFTAGWFSNLVTHLKRRKNILQKVPYSLSMAAWLCTRNPLVPVKRVLFLNVRVVLHLLG